MPIVSAKIKASIEVRQTGAGDFGPPMFTPTIAGVINLTNGTGAAQADILWSDERTIASGGTDDLDLAGILKDAFGVTVATAKIVTILVINAPVSGAANTTNLTIGVGSNPVVGWLGGTTPTLGPIRPGGMFLRAESDAAGICTVTAGTADILRIANSAGAAATYQIVIIGRTA